MNGGIAGQGRGKISDMGLCKKLEPDQSSFDTVHHYPYPEPLSHHPAPLAQSPTSPLREGKGGAGGRKREGGEGQ